MKKLIMSLFIAVIAVTSCSKDEAATEVVKTNSNLVKRLDVTLTTAGSTNIVSSSNFLNYNGNKIVDLTNGANITTYTYTADQITKVINNDGPTFTRTINYTYDNDKLKTASETRSSTNSQGVVTTIKEKIVYIYQTDGTVLQENYTINNLTGAETKETKETIYTFSNGNLVKSVSKAFGTTTTNVSGSILVVPTESRQTDSYEYDTKKNPLLNITGYKQYAIFDTRGAANNRLKESSKNENFTNNVLDQLSGFVNTRDYSFTYNANDYPAQSTRVYTTSVNDVISVKTSVSKYIYE